MQMAQASPESGEVRGTAGWMGLSSSSASSSGFGAVEEENGMSCKVSGVGEFVLVDGCGWGSSDMVVTAVGVAKSFRSLVLGRWTDASVSMCADESATSLADIDGRVLASPFSSTVCIVSVTLPARLDGAVTPPAAGRPSCSLVARQTLYFVSGKRSLTSSIDMSFLSLLLLGRVSAARSIGSPFSS